jgi:hypothetical protein
MDMKTRMTALAMVCAAGAADAGQNTPQLSQRGTLQGERVAHFYINAGTGEAIATLVADRPAGTRGNSQEVWVADNALPCAAFGQAGAIAGVLDDPSQTTSAATGGIYLDWGDIPQDTVIDAVQIEWATQHQDTDTDSDGIGDGVPGFGATWAWFDGDNGFNTCFTRTGLVAFTFFDLPGVVGPVDPNLVTIYTATVDLAGSFSSSISFEIGDSDSDPQSAAVHNANFANGDLDSDTIPDGDLDGDSLADFSYVLQFIQPGTVDFDGDTIPDGDPAAAALTAITLVAPSGPTVFDGTNYTIDPVDPLPAGQGIEEGFDLYTDLNSDGFWEPVGTFWYGGFTCDANGDGTPGDMRPYSQFQHILFGPTNIVIECPADLFPISGGDGVYNFFDVSVFLSAFNNQDPVADFFPTANPDGLFNFFDVSTFLSAFNAGCP